MPDIVNQLDTDTLAALVRAKLSMIELLARLAHKQLGLAEHGATTDLMKLLAAKQTVLGQLDHVQRQLDPFRGQDPDARVWRSPGDRQRCQQDAQRCDDLLAEAMRLEKQGEAALLRRRDQAAAQLAGASAAGEAQAAYARQPKTSSSAMHLHCEG